MVNQIRAKQYSHVTFDSKNTVMNRFRGHPFHRKLFRLFGGVHVFIDLTHQSKVRHFDPIILTNQNITGCKITMNEVFLCKVILFKTNKRKISKMERKVSRQFYWFLKQCQLRTQMKLVNLLYSELFKPTFSRAVSTKKVKARIKARN